MTPVTETYDNILDFKGEGDRIPMSTAYGPFTLEVLRGLTTNRDLLSCSSDGGTVDLWNENDDSGRQLWWFEPADDDPGSYRIKVFGGVDDPSKAYLSGASAQAVFLGPQSAAIHQLWRIVDAENPTVPGNVNLMNRICEVYDNQFLSCTENGTVVDRYDRDDLSGRQQWAFQGGEIPPH